MAHKSKKHERAYSYNRSCSMSPQFSRRSESSQKERTRIQRSPPYHKRPKNVPHHHHLHQQRNEANVHEGGEETSGKKEEKDREKPNFELSGKLAADTNTVNGVVVKYNEPQEARKSAKRWRLYAFKDGDLIQTYYLHRQSAFLFGRDRKVANICLDHPSCSKQHAVLQFRLVKRDAEVKEEEEKADDDDDSQDEMGRSKKRKKNVVLPYIIDLGSSNKTYVNNQPIEEQKYYELFERDVVKFGFSSREYVLLHENSL